MCPSSLVEMNLLKKDESENFPFMKRIVMIQPGDTHVNAAYGHDHAGQETPKDEPEMSPS